MRMGEERNIGIWIMWKTGMRWENAGCRLGQWQSVIILNSQVMHTMWTPLQISPLATFTPLLLSLLHPWLCTDKNSLNVCLVDSTDLKSPPAHPWEVENTWKCSTVRQLHHSTPSRAAGGSPPHLMGKGKAWFFLAWSRNTLSPRVPFSPLSPCRP